MIEAARNQKQTDTEGLTKLLKLTISDKLILEVNVDMQDSLVNGQTGNIEYIESVLCNIRKVYVKFSDEQTGIRAMRSSYLGRQNSWVAIEKCETEIESKKGSASPSIKQT